MNAAAGTGGTHQALLDGFHAAIVVSVIAAGLGVLATTVRLRPRAVAAAEAAEDVPEVQAEAEAA
jgi:hypothetical protein